MKQCSACCKEGIGPKPTTEFWRDSKSADGYRYLCKTHNIAASNEWMKKQPPEFGRTRAKRFRVNNPLGARRIVTFSWLKSRYGLLPDQYQKLFDAQDGCCAICRLKLVSVLDVNRRIKGHAPNEVARVDHCHKTGRVRGLLCFSCNVGLGKFQDDHNLMLKATRYLQATLRKQTFETASTSNRVCDDTAQGEKRADVSRHLVSSTSRGRRLQELSPFFN